MYNLTLKNCLCFVRRCFYILSLCLFPICWSFYVMAMVLEFFKLYNDTNTSYWNKIYISVSYVIAILVGFNAFVLWHEKMKHFKLLIKQTKNMFANISQKRTNSDLQPQQNSQVNSQRKKMNRRKRAAKMQAINTPNGNVQIELNQGQAVHQLSDDKHTKYKYIRHNGEANGKCILQGNYGKDISKCNAKFNNKTKHQKYNMQTNSTSNVDCNQCMNCSKNKNKFNGKAYNQHNDNHVFQQQGIANGNDNSRKYFKKQNENFSVESNNQCIVKPSFHGINIAKTNSKDIRKRNEKLNDKVYSQCNDKPSFQSIDIDNANSNHGMDIRKQNYKLSDKANSQCIVKRNFQSNNITNCKNQSNNKYNNKFKSQANKENNKNKDIKMLEKSSLSLRTNHPTDLQTERP